MSRKPKKAKAPWIKVADGIYWNRETAKDRMKFRARLVTRTADGKRKDHYGPHRPERPEAENDLRKMKNDRYDGGTEKLDAKRVTFRQLSAAYTKAELNPATYHPSDNGDQLVKSGNGRVNYREGLRAMKAFEAYFGDRLISNITRAQIIAWRDVRKNEPRQRKRIDEETGKLKTRSWRDVHQSLHFLGRALNFAIDQKWLEFNPASDKGFKGNSKLIRVGLEKVRTRALDEQETSRLFQAVDTLNDPFLKTVLTFLLGTGIRIEEAERIERGMIDLTVGVYGHIYLPAHVTKTKIARDLPVLTKDIRDAILARFEIIGDEPDALVFTNIQTGCRNGFAKAKAITKIKNFIMKDLRATFATNALDVLPISQVSKYLGHKNPQITMRYLRPTASSHQDNVTRFETHMISRQAITESVAVN